MEERININVSAIDYDKSSKKIRQTLSRLEEMVHGQDDFVMTDSEFAFGWHFYIVSVNRELVQKLSNQLGDEFEKLKGKGTDKKFLTWLTNNVSEKDVKVKFAIKEEMESSKFGIFEYKVCISCKSEPSTSGFRHNNSIGVRLIV